MSETTSSPLKTTWEAAFTDIRTSPNPDSATRFVLKSAVDNVPIGFYSTEDNTILPTYKQRDPGHGFTIRELGPVYVVTKSGNRNNDVWSASQNTSFASDNQQSGFVATDNSRLGSSIANGKQQGLSSNQKIAGGALALYLLYKGLESLASTGESTKQSTSGGSSSLSRLARAANRLENKQYNIFISHSWQYDEHYDRIVDFLDDVPSLQWQNHSVPSTDPLPVSTDAALHSELRNQIRTASVVIVSSGMYGAHSNWISKELDLADELGKSVIAIVPEGQSRVPTKIQEVADTQVGWRKASLVDALAEHA